MRSFACALVILLAMLAAPLAGAYMETDHLDSALSTHQFLMDRIPAILDHDGHPELAALLRDGWLDHLKAGSIASDAYLWRQATHYMSPITHGGLPGFESGGGLADQQFAAAQQAWTAGSRDEALIHLGWAMEVIEDLTVPHHARVTPLDSHAEYEAWVLAHQSELPAATSGLYVLEPEGPGHFVNASRPWDWVDYAAHASYDLFPYVDGPDGTPGIDFRAAAAQMIPLAESLSAGFFYRMMERLDTAPPVAATGGNVTAYVGESVPLNGSGSTDDVAIHAYSWRLPGNVTVFGPTATFQPTAPGDFTVELVVTDAFGKTGSAIVRVTARTPPVAVIRATIQASVDESVTFDGSQSLDNTTLTRYAWTFGDGGAGEGANATHAYASPGDYTVTLRVWDDAGRTAQATATIHVAIPAAPPSKLLAEVVLVFMAAGVVFILWAAARYGRMLRGDDERRREGAA